MFWTELLESKRRALLCASQTTQILCLRLILALLMLSAAAFSSAMPLQIISVIEPPASYIDSHGKLTGYATEQVRLLQKQVGDQQTIQLMPESRALLAAKNKPNVMLFGFSRTKERESQYHWIMPLLRKNWTIFVRSTESFESLTLEQLKNLDRIGVVKGDVRESWLRSQGFTNLELSTSHAQNLSRLQNGQVSAIAYETQGMQYLTREAGLAAKAFKAVLNFNQSEVWLMMSLTTPLTEVQRWQQAAIDPNTIEALQKITENWQDRLWQTEEIRTEIVGDRLQF